MYLLIGKSRRLRAISPDSAFVPGEGETGIVAELPDGFDLDKPMADWVWQDGAWRYDPLPVAPPAPTQEQRITTLESTTDDIILMMADLIGGME